MSEKAKTISLYSFLFVVILTRVFLETAVFSKSYFFGYFVTIHHFCWYLFVFFYFSACCRYILGMKRESVKYLTLLSPVIFTPLVYAYFSGEKLRLQYMEGDLKEVKGMMADAKDAGNVSFAEALGDKLDQFKKDKDDE